MSLDLLPSSELIAASRDLDLAVIDGLLADTAVDFFPSLIEVFENETETRLQAIQSLLDVGELGQMELGQIEEEAHSLAGTSTTFGAIPLLGCAQTLGVAARLHSAAEAQLALAECAAKRLAVIESLARLNTALQSQLS